MEALSFLKFWRPTNNSNTQKENQTTNENNEATEFPNPVMESDGEIDEGDDSFFDLEICLPDFDNKENKCNTTNNNPDDKTHKESSRFDSSEEQSQNSDKMAGKNEPLCAETNFSLSPNDHFSKRKIIPVELNVKPHSPIALLKSAPKFRVFTAKKSKSMATEKTLKAELTMETPKHQKQGSKHFTVKFKMDEVLKLSVLTRENSKRRSGSISEKQSTEDSLPDDASKRFSKDVIKKYLKLIKPLYVKVSKRQSEKVKFSGDLSMASPASSPATGPSYSPRNEKHGNIPSGIRVVCKHLGKSRSASAVIGAASPATRRDDSLLLQDDGIQSAILHCKRSFNASSDSSLLLRSTSNSSRQKLSTSSSDDSYALSRFSSDSSFDKAIPTDESNVCST